jgi:hypothetical protein
MPLAGWELGGSASIVFRRGKWIFPMTSRVRASLQPRISLSHTFSQSMRDIQTPQHAELFLDSSK